MGEVKLVPMGSLVKGRYVVVDGVASIVVDNTHSKPGKHGSAKSNLTAVGMLDGKKRNVVGPASQNIEVPLIEKKNAQILSVDNGKANVMDMESYQTFDLTIPEDMKDTATAGAVVVYWVILDDLVMKSLKSAADDDEDPN
jgi:translation initiation factor 5A